MQRAAAELRQDPLKLRAEVVRLQERLIEAERQREEHEQRIRQLLDYITLLKRKRFGPSADRIPADQLKLFDEAELEALIAELEEEVPPPPSSKPQKPTCEKPKEKPVRRPLPEHLPRVERIIDLLEADKKLIPLMAAMKVALYRDRVIHIDETRLQVLEEPGREATQQ